MKTSTAQLNLIAAREGFRATAYRDGSANGDPKYSIGYGHQIGLADHALMTATLSKSQALSLLSSDVAPLDIQINNAYAAIPSFKPTQNQHDALCDFGFNCGSGALSLILGTLKSNPHDLNAVTQRMLLYNKTHDNNTNALVVSKDLTARRKEEVSLFNSTSTPVLSIAAIVTAGVVGYLMLS